MQRYPDPETFLDEHMQQAAKTYGTWMAEEKIEPTPTLLQAIGEREFERARTHYHAQVDQVFRHNVASIRQQSRQRDLEIRREGARLAWFTCPPVMSFFGGIAWFGFTHGQPLVGALFAVGSAAFLAMLVRAQLGAAV